jgi:hypothetical protein
VGQGRHRHRPISYGLLLIGFCFWLAEGKVSKVQSAKSKEQQQQLLTVEGSPQERPLTAHRYPDRESKGAVVLVEVLILGWLAEAEGCSPLTVHY